MTTKAPDPGQPGPLQTVLSRLLLCAIACLLFPGCHEPKPPPGYYGPTQPLSEVVQSINANNQAIPTLFARHYVEANIVDPKTHKKQFINAGGDLFVRKPRELLMRGKKDPVGLVFEMGSTVDRYWMTVYAGEDTQWWGWYRNLGKPCAQQMPIRPDLVAEVLGISNIETNLLQTPVPVMRFNNDLDVYMLTWNEPLPNRWIAQKEIWYNRKDLRPVKVLLFDANGRVILRANLSSHKPVEIKGQPEAKWPMIATDYDLFFPDTGSTMTLRLSDLALTSRNGNPKEGMIRFPEDPGVSKVMQIDADCDK